MRYIALLRGINVGGNNTVAMAELRDCLSGAGLVGVSTYINSGNVIFESKEREAARLVEICEKAIEERFGFRVVCAVILAEELLEAVGNAPEWWNKDKAVHNALFAIAPKRAEDIAAEVGEARLEYEKVAVYHPIIFWSAPRETFGRTRYSKIVGTKTYQSITIRNANTVAKLVELCKN